MKYDERTCKFNMDTGCVELLLRDGRKISIDCTGKVEHDKLVAKRNLQRKHERTEQQRRKAIEDEKQYWTKPTFLPYRNIWATA